jgi:cell division protein FtsB
MNAVALTGEFVRRGYRGMTLEEKWSLALKILTIFFSIYVTATLSLMTFCCVQITDLKIQLAQVNAQFQDSKADSTRMKAELDDLERKIK